MSTLMTLLYNECLHFYEVQKAQITRTIKTYTCDLPCSRIYCQSCGYLGYKTMTFCYRKIMMVHVTWPRSSQRICDLFLFFVPVVEIIPLLPKILNKFRNTAPINRQNIDARLINFTAHHTVFVDVKNFTVKVLTLKTLSINVRHLGQSSTTSPITCSCLFSNTLFYHHITCCTSPTA